MTATCPKCGKKFKNKPELTTHLQYCGKNQKEPPIETRLPQVDPFEKADAEMMGQEPEDSEDLPDSPPQPTTQTKTAQQPHPQQLAEFQKQVYGFMETFSNELIKISNTVEDLQAQYEADVTAGEYTADITGIALRELGIHGNEAQTVLRRRENSIEIIKNHYNTLANDTIANRNALSETLNTTGEKTYDQLFTEFQKEAEKHGDTAVIDFLKKRAHLDEILDKEEHLSDLNKLLTFLVLRHHKENAPDAMIEDLKHITAKFTGGKKTP